jgi:hypothetical protein
MPTCAKLRKAECATAEGCKWEVGKGCRSASSGDDADELIDALIVTDAELKAVLAQVRPGMVVATDAKVYMKVLITKLVKGTFAKATTAMFGPDEVSKLFILGSNLTEIGNSAELEGADHVANPKRSLINIKMLQKRVPLRNKARKSVAFTEEGARFLAGVVEYALAETLDVAGAYVLEAGKKRIMKAHVKAAIANDKDLAYAFDPKMIGKLVQV